MSEPLTQEERELLDALSAKDAAHRRALADRVMMVVRTLNLGYAMTPEELASELMANANAVFEVLEPYKK